MSIPTSASILPPSPLCIYRLRNGRVLAGDSSKYTHRQRIKTTSGSPEISVSGAQRQQCSTGREACAAAENWACVTIGGTVFRLVCPAQGIKAHLSPRLRELPSTHLNSRFPIMTEPLSLAASVAGLISLTGQVMQLAMGIHKVYIDLRDGPQEVMLLRQGLVGLTEALDGILNLSRHAKASEHEKVITALGAEVKRCHVNLQTLNELTKSAVNLGASGTLSLARMKWKLKAGDVKQLIELLAIHKATILLHLTNLNVCVKEVQLPSARGC